MSTEPDYNFNEPAATDSGSSIALPFALICAAVAVFLAAQTANTFFNRNNLVEGKAQLIKGKAELETARTNREKAVEESKTLQQKLQDLVMDLLLLAKTDPEADAIVKKYNIQQQQPTGTAPAAAPAPAPAP
jgi:hypothetical protein